MIVNLFSDVHLGVSRKAHTTAASSQRLNKRIFYKGLNCVRQDKPNFIAGDLFDKTYNPESVILQGMMFVSRCMVMAGNHDETNNTLTCSSMELLKGIAPDNVLSVRVGEVGFFAWEGMAVVPHHSSQELFLEAINKAKESSCKYLIVHCNRGEFPGETASSTLFISDELEDELLERFDRIFYGHIHKPGLYKDGRVCVIGNVHPTSFGDISDKFRWELNTSTGELTKHKIWSVDRFVKITLDSDLPDLSSVDFVEIIGKGTRRDTALFVDKIWKENPELLAVRPNVDYVGVDGQEVKEVNLENLSKVIEEELKDTDLFETYKELSSED